MQTPWLALQLEHNSFIDATSSEELKHASNDLYCNTGADRNSSSNLRDGKTAVSDGNTPWS